jgi:predicted amidohydrolase
VLAVTSFSVGFAADSEEKMKPIRETFEPAVAPSSRTHGKVAVVQWAPPMATQVGVSAQKAEQIKQVNRDILAQFTREAAAKGAKMVIHSEFSVVGYPDIPELPSEDDNYRNRADIAPYVETVPGPSTRFFGQLARELGVYIQFGLAEKDARTDQYFNSAVMVGPDGNVLGSHRKVNLFKQESDFVTAGTQPTVFRTVFGLTAPLICADVYGRNPMQALAQRGVQVLTLSTSWAQMNTGMGYFQRGAQWVGAYLLAANQPYFPDSGVINPDGSLQSHIRQTDGIAYGYLPYVR